MPRLTDIRIESITREAFLLRATLAAATACGAGAAAPFLTRAIAQDGGGDVGILNFALTLEFLEAALYNEGARQVIGLTPDHVTLVQTLRDNEEKHVDALREAIKQAGGQPVARPRFEFGAALADGVAFLKLANTLEDTGVSAYNGAATMISSAEVLATASSIVQVEARHAALIRLARDRPPAPLAFDKPSDRQSVLDAVSPLIKTG